MIEITLAAALVIYSTILAGCGLVIWLYTELRSQYRRRVLEQQHLWRCVICAYVYLDEKARALSACPRCGSLNAIDDKGARYVDAGPVKRIPLERAREADRPRRNPGRSRRPGHRARGGRRRK